jgi:hypothetical protein
MPPADEVQRSLSASWRMMTGRADAIRMHDLSLDGFWNSFFAIVVALPALGVGWVASADTVAFDPGDFASRVSAVVRLGLVDMVVWLLPLAALAAAAPLVGLQSRFVHYVVATNWGGAIFAWVMLPPSLIWMVTGELSDLVAFLSLALFGASMVLSWRLTTAAIGRGPAVGSAVFFGMLAFSFMTLFAVQSLLGISSAA